MTAPLLEHFDHLLATPDDVEALNRAILQLAVQGKLTRREPGDEPARELLERIRAEKSKKHSKAEALPPIGEGEKPFDLPEGWECAKLAEIADIGTGVAKGKKYGDSERTVGLPYLRVANVQRGYLDLAEIKEIEIREDEATKYVLRNGDLLLTEGGDADKLGRSAIWHGEVPNCIHQNHIFRARPYAPLKPGWLMLYINSPYGKGYFLGASKQTTNLASINKTQLSNCPIPLPPLAEQHRIVARVEELFAQTRALAEKLAHAEAELTNLNQAALHHLLAAETPEDFDRQWAFILEHFDALISQPEHVAPLRQTILELAVRGKLTHRESGDEPASELLKRIRAEKANRNGKAEALPSNGEGERPFSLPKGWQWVRFGDVSSVIGDVDHRMPQEIPEGIPYISPRDFIGDDGISFSTAKRISRRDFEDLAAKIRPERGDIIFPRYGTIGVNRFVEVDIEFLASYSCAIIKYMKGFMDPRYVFFYSISPLVTRETRKYVNKTTQANVGIKSIQRFVFPLPPLAEQGRIVARVEALLKQCDALEAALREAQEERGRLREAVLAGVCAG